MTKVDKEQLRKVADAIKSEAQDCAPEQFYCNYRVAVEFADCVFSLLDEIKSLEAEVARLKPQPEKDS